MRKNKGFTLIETMMAMMIFVIVMLFCLTFFVFGNRRLAKANEVSYAVQLAKDDMESVRAVAYNLVVPAGATSITNPQTGIAFTRVRGVQTVGAAGETYKIISVTVTWRAADTNNPMSVSVHSIASPPYL
jgi:prepilin-type N-terminal cleavage/methylation domain-containing protein